MQVSKSLSLDSELFLTIERLRITKEENRSFSGMIEKLIIEALEQRKTKKK